MTGSKPDVGCVFCNALALGMGEPLVLWVGRRTFVILNKYPYNNGHLMVVPHRHVSSLAGLDAGEMQEIGTLVQRSELVLTDAYQPHGINVGVNLGKPAGAGILDHVHVHMVPRWNGDTNFMTVVGATRVLPEELPETAAKLRPVFARLVTTR